MADHETDRNPEARGGGVAAEGERFERPYLVVILAAVLVVAQLENGRATLSMRCGWRAQTLPGTPVGQA